MRILVVEDKEKNRKVAARFLGGYVGLQVVCVETANETKGLLEGMEGAILDLNLPAEKGQEPTKEVGIELAELCKELRIPYVICTVGEHGPQDPDTMVTSIYDNVEAVRDRDVDLRRTGLRAVTRSLPRRNVYKDKNEEEPWRVALEVLFTCL